MKIPAQATATALSVLFTLAVTNQIVQADGRSLSRFKVTGITGWTLTGDGYSEFDPDQLYDIINGGADLYIDKGLKRGGYQKLLRDDSLQCEIFVEDFGSPENAEIIFTATTETATGSLKIGSGNDERMRVKEFIGGILVYMHFENYYFEISVSGFDTTEEAGVGVKPFIDYFEGILTKK